MSGLTKVGLVHRSTFSRILLALGLAVALAFGFGLASCGDDGDSGDSQGQGDEVECGGHGSPHGDHCHCDAGYAPFQGSCEAIDELPVCGSADAVHDGSCICEDPTQECQCGEGQVSDQSQDGKYYCKQDIHHEHEGE